MGKGDSQRPPEDPARYRDEWDRIFAPVPRTTEPPRRRWADTMDAEIGERDKRDTR